MSDTNSRVVITGLGLVSPLGLEPDAFGQALLDGKTGIRSVTELGHLASPKNAGAYVSEFDDKAPRKLFPKVLKKNAKVMCREIQLGVASAVLALEDAGIVTEGDAQNVESSRIGVEFGANLMLSPPNVLDGSVRPCVDDADADRQFQYDRWGKEGMPRLEPLWLLKYLPNMPACHITIAANAHGPSNSLTQDDASAGLAIGEAMRIIDRGAADVMIVGTTGTRLHSVKTIHVALWKELASGEGDPAEWCRPFSRDRIGEVIAEGSGAFILETEEHAKARGAKIYGSVLGTGASCVADRSGQPNLRAALANAMRRALADSGVSVDEIGHINAHAAGSVTADAAEAAAIYDVFGERAGTVPVTSLKTALGNSGSGSGMLEIAGSVLALSNGKIPRTLNYSGADDANPLNVVSVDSASAESKLVLKTSVTRMGQAVAVVVEAA